MVPPLYEIALSKKCQHSVRLLLFYFLKFYPFKKIFSVVKLQKVEQTNLKAVVLNIHGILYPSL